MKTSLVLLTLCSILLLGGLGLWIASSRDPSAARTSANASNASDPVAPPSGADARSGELLARVDALSRDVDGLRADLAALKAGAARQPAVEAAAEKPLDEPASAFAAAHRDAILKVIEEDRQEQKRKLEEEQRARDLQAALSRAERTAKQFGLLADQQKQLADIYVLERQKMVDLRTQSRDPNAAADPQAQRQGYRDLREWRLTQLTNRFGPDLGARIDEFDNQRPGGGNGGGNGGGPGGGRRGNRGQGSQNGGNGSGGGS